MTAAEFLIHFGEIANAPGGVARLRELVLNFALAERLRDQENSSVNEWPSVTLIEVASFHNGDRSKNYPSKAFRVTRGVPFINAGHLANGDVSLEDMDYISEEHFEKLGGGKIEAGDVLYCLRGSLGKCAVAKSVTRGAIASSLLIIRPSERIASNFLYWYLVSPTGSAMIRQYDNGSAQPNLSAANVKRYVLPLPPLAEQKRIVAKVEELMALCDQLEAQQQERERRFPVLSRTCHARFAEAPTPANLNRIFDETGNVSPDDLRRSILTLAVQGKLIPQHPDDEPAEICLTRLGLQATLRADETTEALPSSWMRVRFEDVALTAGGVTLGRNLVGRETVSLPYLRVANVKRGEIDTSVIKEVSIATDEVERYALRENDLLMTEGGDWDKVGRAAIWKGQIPVCLHQNHVFRSRFRSNEILPVWFERYFNSPVGRSYFESASKQTTNLASINMRQVRGCPVPFPPLAEQRRIVAKVDELMALVDQLEAQQQERDKLAEAFAKACVASFTTT